MTVSTTFSSVYLLTAMGPPNFVRVQFSVTRDARDLLLSFDRILFGRRSS